MPRVSSQCETKLLGARAGLNCLLSYPRRSFLNLVSNPHFQVLRASLSQGQRLSLEGQCCVFVTAAAAEPHLLVDLKYQASLFSKLLLKNRRGMLYNPFSEKTLLIPVGRRTSCEMRAGGWRQGRDLYPKDRGVERVGHLRVEAVDTTFHLG